MATTAAIPLGFFDMESMEVTVGWRHLPVAALAIDSVDEVDPDLNRVKGQGGSLLWKEMVESAS